MTGPSDRLDGLLVAVRLIEERLAYLRENRQGLLADGVSEAGLDMVEIELERLKIQIYGVGAS